MDASECCMTSGCNCAATTSSEFISKVPVWVWPSIVVGAALILVIIIYYQTKFYGGIQNDKVE